MPVLVLAPGAPSLADAVVVSVRNAIAAGELVPGEIYSVYQLAELLGISRSPVREAITRMADAGLVEIARNRGFRLRVPSAHDIAEIVEIRLALEAPAARRVAEEGADDQLSRLTAALERMAEAAHCRDEAAFWAADRALHDVLMRAAGNGRAADIVAELRATTALLGPPTTASGRTLSQILDEHRLVLDAVLARNGAAAEAAMREHLVETGALLARNLGHP